MNRIVQVGLTCVTFAMPLLAETYKQTYPMPCSDLWPAVKATVRNSGYYGIIFLDSNEMIASFSIGAKGNGVLRVESAVLNATTPSTCELQVEPLAQSPFSNDGSDFKKRLDISLVQMRSKAPSGSTGDVSK